MLQLFLTDGSFSLAEGTASNIVLLLLKLVFMLGALIYVLFAGVVTRQINLMRRTVETNFSGTVRAIGLIHLGLAILVFIMFFLVL